MHGTLIEENVLFDERSARIARNMHLRDKPYREAVCLRCHTTNVAPSLVDGRIDAEDGVQCEACHGPASGWRAEHAQPNASHQRSVSHGMTDLRASRTRAAVCLTCHLGDDERKVDHELIASGHPILVFELDNYTEAMPAHWKGGKETHGLPAWATGQAVAFIQSLSNLAHHANGENWPEFSDLTCANCHHTLVPESARQERGWPGRAGVPSWGARHWPVLRLLIARVAPDEVPFLDGRIERLNAAVSRMRDPAAVASAADELRAEIERLSPRISALSWREADIIAMMQAITSDSRVTADVHTAEQAALALQSLASTMTRKRPSLLAGPMTRAIDNLFAALKDRSAYDAGEFAMKLRAVKPEM